jgi:hypothetical protein
LVLNIKGKINKIAMIMFIDTFKSNFDTFISNVIMGLTRDTPPYGHAPTIPNIIDLSGKTKKLWSGQASLRRSGRRKNQTKTICLLCLKEKGIN